jgi:hypothetical protein
MEGPSSYELTGVRNIQASHGSITSHHVTRDFTSQHPPGKASHFISARRSYEYDQHMFVLRKERDAESASKVTEQNTAVLFGATKNLRRMKRKPQQASSTAVYSVSASRDQGLLSGHAVFWRLRFTILLQGAKARDHRCLSPFLTFPQIEVSSEFCAVGVPASVSLQAHQNINSHGNHDSALVPTLVSNMTCIH